MTLACILWHLLALMVATVDGFTISHSAAELMRSDSPVQGERINGGRHSRRKNRDGFSSNYQKYHTSDEIISKIQKLQDNCAVTLKSQYVNDTKDAKKGQLFLASLGDPKAAKKVMIAANEHARELFTGEVVLAFIERACDKDKPDHKLVKEVSFILLPLVNKKGRELVETGENECQRRTVKSEGDVDLNRNMDVDWGKGSPQIWGEKPFSTFQARIMRDVASSSKPLAYIDLHTGARTLMTSWGYRPQVDPDFSDQEKVLKLVQSKHCPDCIIGSNRVAIGYENPGEAIDHMYAKEKIKYSSLWELYEGPGDSCVGMFNPPDTEYDKYLEQWVDALFTYGGFVKAKVAVDERAHPFSIVTGTLPFTEDKEQVASMLEQAEHPKAELKRFKDAGKSSDVDLQEEEVSRQIFAIGAEADISAIARNKRLLTT